MKISTDSHIKKIMPEAVKLLALLFWLLVWQIVANMMGNTLVLPSPITTLKVMYGVIMTPSFFPDLGMTLFRVFGGVGISVAIGIIFGILGGLNKMLYTLLEPFVTITRTLPVVSVIILINLWVKSSFVPLVVTFLVCFPITFTNVVEGIHHTDLNLLEMAKVYNVSFQKVLRNIYLPSIKPFCVSALMTAIGMGWKVTVTAEVLANALPSVGMNLYYAKVYLETETLFAWTLIVVICSFAIEKITNLILKRIQTGESNGY
ncbi:MAG: ABC transporter permease subunit [Eubacterium sp.]